MVCCVVAAYFIFRYILRWRDVAKYLGFEFKDSEDEEGFGWQEYCELDQYEN